MNDILLVDDDPSFIQDFEFIFGKDFTLDKASSYTEALEKIKSNYDIVLIDVELSPGNKEGLDLLQKIRGYDKVTPIYVISKYDHASISKTLGATAFLAKKNMSYQKWKSLFKNEFTFVDY